MASYRKRHGKWQVQIRRTAKGSASKTFIRKQDAIVWAREQEILLQNGRRFNSETPDLTIYCLMKKYRDIVTPQKRGHAHEARRIERLLKDRELMTIRLQKALAPRNASLRPLQKI